MVSKRMARGSWLRSSSSSSKGNCDLCEIQQLDCIISYGRETIRSLRVNTRRTIGDEDLTTLVRTRDL